MLVVRLVVVGFGRGGGFGGGFGGGRVSKRFK
jgi:hypothetical protein